MRQRCPCLGSSGAALRRWYLDPIDGTSWFVEAVPRWATLIAIAEGATVVAAVMDLPLLGERWWASRGDGAFRNGTALRVSRRAPLRPHSSPRICVARSSGSRAITRSPGSQLR